MCSVAIIYTEIIICNETIVCIELHLNIKNYC